MTQWALSGCELMEQVCLADRQSCFALESCGRMLLWRLGVHTYHSLLDHVKSDTRDLSGKGKKIVRT